MTDYSELVKALQWCAKPIPCSKTECPRKNMDEDCACHVLQDAAAAIEALEAEVKRLEPKRGEMVEVVRCKDCDSWDTEHSSGRKSLGNYVCICQEWSDGEDARWVYTGEDEFCSRGERRAEMEVQE